MMRMLAIPVTGAMLLAAGWSGWSLWQVLMSPREVPAAAPPPVALSVPPDPSSRPTGPVPPIFGPPLPPGRAGSAPAPDPVVPEPPRPPLASLGYRLNGVVRVDGATWATLSHPAGERLVRTGDQLAPGIVVTRIDADGVWLSRSGGAPELLGFPD